MTLPAIHSLTLRKMESSTPFFFAITKPSRTVPKLDGVEQEFQIEIQ